MSAEDTGQTMEAPLSFITHSNFQDGKTASDQLVLTYQRQRGLIPLEAVEVVSYTQALQLDLDDFSEKKILNAGSGFGKFKSALQKLGISAEVTNYDDNESWGKRGDDDVVGKIEDLPFDDNSFDMIIAHFAIPFNLDETVDPTFMAKQLKELIRVLKPGGILKYRPLRMFRNWAGENTQSLMDTITKNALKAIEEAFASNPNIKVHIARGMQDDGISYDEVLEITR